MILRATPRPTAVAPYIYRILLLVEANQHNEYIYHHRPPPDLCVDLAALLYFVHHGNLFIDFFIYMDFCRMWVWNEDAWWRVLRTHVPLVVVLVGFGGGPTSVAMTS